MEPLKKNDLIWVFAVFEIELEPIGGRLIDMAEKDFVRLGDQLVSAATASQGSN